MRATIPFPFHGLYRRAANVGFLPGYRPLLEAFPVAPPVLDIGCGPGDVTHRLSRRQVAVGVDVDPRMVRMARKRHGDGPGCRFEVADAAALPFDDGHFGAAWTSESFHHWRRPADGIREAFRVLRPGGELWIVEARSDMSRDEFHHGFGLPALPGLYGGLKRVFAKHGVTPAATRRTVAMLTGAGFAAEARPHGAWMVLHGTRPRGRGP